MTPAGNTLTWLRELQQHRATNGIDPPRMFGLESIDWLIQTAINRRAGEIDARHDRVTYRLNHRGEPCRKMDGDARRHLTMLARRINTPRLHVYRTELGEWARVLMARIPDRFSSNGD